MSSFEPSEGTSWAGRPIARQIDEAIPRSRMVVTGTIGTTRLVGAGHGAFLQCVLADGTGEIDLLFGRSRVPGVEAGARCTVEGTVGRRSGRLVIWNPWYRVEPRQGDLPPPGSPVPVREGSAVPAGALPAPPEAARRPAAAHVEVEATGHYRIYLGAAAGVGKTVAMLEEGHRRRRRGADVVVGLVECHGRYLTESRVTGLEVVPRKLLDHRGMQVAEMDLEAVLARHPRVALVDELAHTNVPGSGAHAKRWEDVLQLVGSGIDVITTVNIQHLESIADAVERISGAPVRERVPDWVVRQADQIELVDSSPEQLRRRIVHGNIYPPAKVEHALSHFFRADNLRALRELALRFVADATEDELVAHLRESTPEEVWETAERILVGVTAAPGTDAIIRRASRMAARVKADLHVAHVGGAEGGAHAGAGCLSELRRVASDVGADWSELAGDDPAQALVEFARKRQVTQIVVGSSQRRQWQEVAGGGSIVRRLSRLAAGAGIDVHIIARRESVA